MGFFDAPDPPVYYGNRQYSSQDHFNTYRNWVNTSMANTGTQLSNQGIADAITALDTGQIEGLDNLDAFVKAYQDPASVGGGGSGGGDYMANEWANFQKYAPEAMQLSMDLFNQFAPQIANTQKNIIEEMFPETSKIQETLSGQVLGRIKSGPTVLPDEVSDFYKRSVREAQSDRGLLTSGMGGRAEAEGEVRLARDFYNQDVSTALALNASLPQISIPSGSSVMNNDYFNTLLSVSQSGRGGGGYSAPTVDPLFFQGYGEREGSEFSRVFGGALSGGIQGYQMGGPVGGAIGAGIGGVSQSNLF